MPTWKQIHRNKNLLNNLYLREKITDLIREYFKKEKFHEIETPLLVPSVIPESYLEVFTTTQLDRRRNKRIMFLTASPEASLKKLLAAGIGNCFEITRSFRNGETDSHSHCPEFTLLEWYRVNTDYKQIMIDCESLYLYIYNRYIYNRLYNSSHPILTYQDKKINLKKPWERISISNSIYKYAGVDFDEITDKTEIQTEKVFNVGKIAKIAAQKGYTVTGNNTWEEIFNQIFLNEVEPHLGMKGKPTIIYDYPAPLAALAKLKKDDPRLAERFELYIGGLELGDCYTELIDWKEQKNRFDSEMQMIKHSKKTQVKSDNEFIEALKSGIPKCSGMAMGIDRMVMLFGNLKDIKDSKFTADCDSV